MSGDKPPTKPNRIVLAAATIHAGLLVAEFQK
jgi:hypothetical protein